MLTKLLALAQSSKGDGSLSLRVKSFLIGIVPAVLFIGGLLGWSGTEDEVKTVIDHIGFAIEGSLTVVASGYHIYGWARALKFKRLGAGKYRQQ